MVSAQCSTQFSWGETSPSTPTPAATHPLDLASGHTSSPSPRRAPQLGTPHAPAHQCLFFRGDGTLGILPPKNLANWRGEASPSSFWHTTLDPMEISRFRWAARSMFTGTPPPHSLPYSQASRHNPRTSSLLLPLWRHQGSPVPLPLSRSPVGHVMPDSTSRASAVLVKGFCGAARPPHAGKAKEPAFPSTPGLLITLHIPGSLLRLVGGVWRAG